MKRLQYLLLLFTIWGVVACSYNELPEELSKMANPIETPIVLNVETRAETYDGKVLDQNYFVSEADLENYVRYRRSATKQPNLTVKEVKSYGFDSSQTLFYILNYEKGWEVVSADKRVQPTLAYGDEGAFTMDCDNEPMKFWMNILANGVLQTRQRTGDSAVATASTASKEESDKADDEEQNVAFWNVISPTQQQNSRGGGILIPIWGPHDSLSLELLPIHRYYIPHAQTTNREYNYIGSRIPTFWGQSSPWNWYCPYKIDTISLEEGEDKRVPAGCVAVAGAQLLYSLNRQKDMEMESPIEASCTGNASDWSRTFSNFLTTSWQYMAVNSNGSLFGRQVSAALIAYVGQIADVSYGDDGSSSTLVKLKNGLQHFYGITCSYNDYDPNLAIANLNFSPLVVRAAQNMFSSGHAWIIDEYLITTTYTNRYYIDTQRELSEVEIRLLTIDDATGYTTDVSVAKQFHMNWGWGGTSDGYFGLLPEDWDESQGAPYDYEAAMLYNFEQI